MVVMVMRVVVLGPIRRSVVIVVVGRTITAVGWRLFHVLSNVFLVRVAQTVIVIVVVDGSMVRIPVQGGHYFFRSQVFH